MTENEVNGWELVWVKLWGLEDGAVYARLLNEPAQEGFGVHVGDVLPLALEETDEGIHAYAIADQAIKS